ncbi:MAG: carboxymuconolactone decarboxylase family protein [Pseudonocardiaceae bacterium]
MLFGEVWKRPQLSPRDRGLVTVAALVAGRNAEQLTFHLQYAKDNGATEDELIEAILHLAFYSGGRRRSPPSRWPSRSSPTPTGHFCDRSRLPTAVDHPV